MDFPNKIKAVKENIEAWLHSQEEANPDTEYRRGDGRIETCPGWHKEINSQDGFSYLIFDFNTVNELPNHEFFGKEEIIITKDEHKEVINYLALKGYLEIIEEKSPYSLIIAILPKKKPTIKLKTLELIAKELKNNYTGLEIIKLLEEAGVDKRLIIYPQSKWLIFYTVFSELTNYEKDYNLLFKIICDAIHPLNLNGNIELSKKLILQFNNYLEYDVLEIVRCQDNSFIIVDKMEELSDDQQQAILEEIEEEERKQLEYLAQPDNKEKISLLRKSYQLLMNVVYSFCENPAHPTIQLNEAYQFLDKLIMKTILNLGLRKGTAIRNFNNYSSLFSNLFAAEKSYREQGKELSWRIIRPEMNAIYGEIEELYQEVNGNDIIDEPEKQKKLNDIQLYLSELKEKTKEIKEQANTKEAPVTKIEITNMPELKIKKSGKETENDKIKFPYKLPAGTIWENFIIKFIDDENIYIQIKNFKHTANYKELGMVSKGKNPGPGELWNFLKVLAKLNGEISVKDQEVRDKYKKQKELLAKVLQNYFSIDYDPFYPYNSTSEKSGKSYKIKCSLFISDEKSKDIKLSKEKEKIDLEKNEDKYGIKEYLNRETPQI